MAHLKNYKQLLYLRKSFKLSTRSLYKCVKDKSSKSIRKRFLDYFVNEHNHTFVRSSPVVPFCDPTVPFVNAGMNQFKGIFLGDKTFTHSKVANTQKCVRIGGKHNDLNVVGTDGYHHTFFEMMGNWSFGECSKKDACKLSWDLLTTVYCINPSRLYVTYFGGDESLKLDPDLETKEVWKSLGISDDRIVPYGVKDNFWEMGLTGPCGPCTEIHFDHFGETNRYKFINKGLPDLTELWNIVFIQYNKTMDGRIEPLPHKHVDTGMGFERLTAIMQGKISNYDTDIFVQIFNAISKICNGVPKYGGKYGENDWDSIDTVYRILADHVRMISVCLADGMIPEQNQKLRRIMRRAYLISETNFKRDSGLLKELTNYVVENLGPTYPEMEKNIKQIHQIVDYEEDLYKSVRSNVVDEWKKIADDNKKLSNLDITESPGLIKAYKELNRLNSRELTPELSYKLYDTYGLDEDVIHSVAEALNLKYNVDDFQKELLRNKELSKLNSIRSGGANETSLINGLNPTNDNFKYDYKKHDKNYSFNDLRVEIVNIINDQRLVKEVQPDSYCSLILSKTNLYAEAGGQISDKGTLQLKDGVFEIANVRNLKGCILHDGIVKNKSLKVGDAGTLNYDHNFRLNVMRNHTGVHLLNSALKTLKTATCQKSSKLTNTYLNIDVAIFGDKLKVDEVQALENLVNKVIKQGVDINTVEMDSGQLYSCDNVTLIPGETYPENGIRLVEIVSKDGFISREPCCGTHVLNTADLEDFCIVGFKSLGKTTTSLYALTGPRATLARNNGVEIVEQVTQLQKNIDDNIDKPEVLEMVLAALRDRLKYNVESDDVLPVAVKMQCLGYLSCIEKQLKQVAKGTLKEFIEMEMQNVLETNRSRTKKNQEYLIHYLRCSMVLENVPLQRATKMCPDLPILVIAYSDSMVKARCCVPEHLKNKNFNAEKWLKESVSAVFKSAASAPKGQDPTLICNMKARKINLQDWDTLLKRSLESATEYVEKYL